MALIVAIRASGFNFHGGNTGSNPVGDAKSFQQLTIVLLLYIGTKKAQLVPATRMRIIEESVFSH
jgi:hypothetical protein